MVIVEIICPGCKKKQYYDATFETELNRIPICRGIEEINDVIVTGVKLRPVNQEHVVNNL